MQLAWPSHMSYGVMTDCVVRRLQCIGSFFVFNSNGMCNMDLLITPYVHVIDNTRIGLQRHLPSNLESKAR